MSQRAVNRKHRVAKFVTNISVIPVPLAFAHMIVFTRLSERGPVPSSFIWYTAALYAAPVFAVLLLILFRKRFRLGEIRFADLQLSDRNERRPAILFFVAGALVSIPLALGEPSGVLIRYTGALLILVLILYAITYSTPYKVSLHAAGWSSALGLAVITAADGRHPGFVWISLLLLCALQGVSTARLVCRLEGANPDEGHLPGEVFVGGILGAIVSVTAFMF